MIEAGFPSSNPKEEELFASLADLELERGVVCAFGMTRRRGVEAAEDPALLTVTGSFAPVVTLVGKTWGLHLEKVTKVSREENLAMIAESVAFCRERGKRVVYDAEHFFDSYREDPGYALSCLRGGDRRRGRERHPLRHQRGEPAEPGRRRRPRSSSPASATAPKSASTPTTTRAAGSPTASPRSTPGRAWCRGP